MSDQHDSSHPDTTIHGAPGSSAQPAISSSQTDPDPDATAAGAADGGDGASAISSDIPAPVEPSPAAPDAGAAHEDDAEPLPTSLPILGDHPPRVVAIALSGPHDGQVFLIATGSALVGRLLPNLTIELPDDQWVSREHAQLSYRDGGWWLADRESSNGTWLDSIHSQITEEVPLPLGAIFRVGHTDLMLSADSDLVSQAAQPV